MTFIAPLLQCAEHQLMATSVETIVKFQSIGEIQSESDGVRWQILMN